MSGEPNSKYSVVFVLGGPGAGKGTQCERIVKEFGFVHLSAGELLRAERIREGSIYKEEIHTHFRNGTIVPVSITCALLSQAMDISGKQQFLIDGFPRNQDNLEGWIKVMGDIAQVKCVLLFTCSTQVCIDRCLKRGETSGRADDNIESLRKRILTYTNATMYVIDYFRTKGLVREVPAEPLPDVVFESVKKVLSELD